MARKSQEPVGTVSGLIPLRYRSGMPKQIAVRLPDPLIEFIDEEVGSGKAPSRAAVVKRALERERRRAMAERDAEILAEAGPDADLEDFVAYTSARFQAPE